VKSTNYEVPRCVRFSSLLSRPLSSFRRSSVARCSETHSSVHDLRFTRRQDEDGGSMFLENGGIQQPRRPQHKHYILFFLGERRCVVLTCVFNTVFCILIFCLQTGDEKATDSELWVVASSPRLNLLWTLRFSAVHCLHSLCILARTSLGVPHNLLWHGYTCSSIRSHKRNAVRHIPVVLIMKLTTGDRTVELPGQTQQVSAQTGHERDPAPRGERRLMRGTALKSLTAL
jgi:hypothetical protein